MPEPYKITQPNPPMIDVKELLQAGRNLNAVVDLDGGDSVVLLPQGMSVVSLAPYLPPDFIKQNVALTHADSFLAYVKNFKSGATQIFAAVTDRGASFLAALDYHGGEASPDRVAHRATYTCQPTVEWQTWMGRDRKEMTQEDFALFLEENERLFLAPNGAELLELITTLEGKSHVNFTSGVRLQSRSVRLTFEEDTDVRGGVGTGQIEIPQVLSLAIAPFEGEVPYSVKARLRYQITSRKLVFWYETITPHLIVRDAAKLIVERVSTETGIPVLMGSI